MYLLRIATGNMGCGILKLSYLKTENLLRFEQYCKMSQVLSAIKICTERY